MRVISGLTFVVLLLGLPAAAQTQNASVTFSSSSLSVTATAVSSGGSITTGAKATSSASGDTINYAWSATCNGGLSNGSFATPTNYGTTWTASANTTASDQSCSLTLKATATPSGASASLSEQITVHAQSSTTTTTTGTPVGLSILTPASIFRTSNLVNSADTITMGLQLMAGQTAAGLTFLWADSCGGGIGNGSLSSATDPSPTWTAPNNTTNAIQACTFTVTITRGAYDVALPFTISVQAANTPENGWWWSSSVPGIGFSIEVNASGAIFMGAYMYDSSGNPVWYVANLTSTTESTAGIPPGGVFGSGGSSSSSASAGWTGTLQSYTGGPALGATYQAAQSSNVGPVSLSCSSAQQCSVTMPNSSAPLAIERYAFVTGGTTRPVANVAGMPQTGWWWNNAQGGLGYFVEVQTDSAGNDVAFIAYYLYGQNGASRWFITDGTVSNSAGVFGAGGSATVNASAVQCNGGASLGNLVASPPIRCSDIPSGNVQEVFTSATSGSVDYVNDTLTIAVQRLSF